MKAIPNRVIRRRKHVVGSNVTRTCRTVRQIEEEGTAAQQKLDQERTRMLQKASHGTDFAFCGS